MKNSVPLLTKEDIQKRKISENLIKVKDFLEALSIKYNIPVMEAYDSLSTLIAPENSNKSMFVISHVIRELIYCMTEVGDDEGEKESAPICLMESISTEDFKRIKNCKSGKGFSIAEDGKTLIWKGKTFKGDWIPALRDSFSRLDWEGAISRVKIDIDKQNSRNNYLSQYLNKYSSLKIDEISDIVKTLDSVLKRSFNNWAHIRYGGYSKKPVNIEDFYENFDYVLKALLNCSKSELKAFSKSDMIDETLSTNGDINLLWPLIKKDPLQKEYFLRNLGEEYFEKLNLLNVFKKIPNVEEEDFLPVNCYWPEGLYLLKISSTQAKEVSEILEIIDFGDHHNYRAKEIYIKIILSLYEQNIDIAPLVKRIHNERWVTNQYIGILGLYPLKDLVSKLVEKGTYDGMEDLIYEVCGVKREEKSGKSEEEYNYQKPESLLRDYLVIDILESLAGWNQDVSVLKALRNVLCDYMEEEMSRKSSPSGLNDYSYISKPVLEDYSNEYHDYGTELINTVMKLSVKLLSGKESNIVEETLTPRKDYSIFRRMKMLLYSKEHSLHKEIIALYTVKEFGDVNVRLEYLEMLKESFTGINEEQRTELFFKVGEFLQEDSSKYYIARFFNAIKDSLTEKEKITYKACLDLNLSYNEPTAYSYSRTARDSSPYTLKEISDYSIDEIFFKITGFTEEEEAEWVDKPTEEGFIESIKSDYSQRSDEYWNSNDKLVTLFTKPKFLKAFIQLFLQRNLSLNDFRKICKIISDFSEYAIDQDGELKEYYYVFYSILQAIEKYIEEGKTIDYEALDNVLKIFLNMVDSLDIEDTNMEDFYSKSVNTIEGSVYHCYFALLTNQNTEEVVKNKIEIFLTPLLTEDRNSIINAIAGRYFLFLDDEFYLVVKNSLFLNEKTLFSVWSGFLITNQIFRKDFRNMVDCYWFVIDHFEGFREYKFEDMLGHRFYEFVTLGYLFFSSNYTEDLFWTMFERSREQEVINIIHFIGMQIRNSRNKPKRAIVKKIWRKFLSRKKYNKFYTLLGLWIDVDFFNEDKKWLLETVEKTLRKTGGNLEGEYDLGKQMEGLLNVNDEQLLQCLKILANIPHQHYSLFSDKSVDLNKVFKEIEKNIPSLKNDILEIKNSLYSKGYEIFRER